MNSSLIQTFADAWDAVADSCPAEPCQIQGNRILSWGAVSSRANALARYLLSAGAQRQDKVAQYLYNCPEYMESVWACFKAGLVPVNTNYRYREQELVYLWTNADIVAVVFHGCFTETIERIRSKLPKVKTWLHVDDECETCPSWAQSYDATVRAEVAEHVHAPWGRSVDDIYMLYTGGTTGLPKGVMWRQSDVYQYLLETQVLLNPEGGRPPRPVLLPASPLMHGTGLVSSFRAMMNGGAIVTLLSRRLDVEELLDTIETRRITTLVIVGDAFGRPMLHALEENPSRWNIASIKTISSSGVMWSVETKQALLRHNQQMSLFDSLGSAEAMGIASSLTTAADALPTGKFLASKCASVISSDGRILGPGSGEVGLLAVRGCLPVGYYKDEQKTAATFRIINGERWSVPGDFGLVEQDGTLRFFGRGSLCINTGGEKVFPEEVEEVLKAHPTVRDAIVVGLPDTRFGESIHAAVEREPGSEIDPATLIAHVKSVLAGYKAPRSVIDVGSLGRAANGKADYQRWKNYLATAVASANAQFPNGRSK